MSESATLIRPANTVSPPAAPWREGLESARALARPGIVLQIAALGLVLAYYFVPATRGAFDVIASWRDRGGYLYSGLSTALFGGLLPFLYLHAQPNTRTAHPWSHLAFFLPFWAWKGMEVDLWYRILGAVLGTEPTARNVVLKVLADQLLFNPLYAGPVGNLCIAWKDAGFRWGPVAANVRAGNWYKRSVVPVLLAVWMIWLPAVSCIFSLPASLQIPLFSIVLCFWSMLFAHVTLRQNRCTA